MATRYPVIGVVTRAFKTLGRKTTSFARAAKGKAAVSRAVAEALEQRQLLTVTSVNFTPASSNVVAGTPISCSLGANSDDQSLSGYYVAWGDGYSDSLSADATTASHTFSNAGIFTSTVTAFDDAGAPGYAVTQQIWVNPPAFTIAAYGLSQQAGQSFTAEIGSIPNFYGNAGDYVGSLTLGGASYPIAFAADYSGNLNLYISGNAPQTCGTSTASVSVDDVVAGLTASASNTLTATIAPPSFSIVASSIVNTQPGQTYTIGTIYNYFGNPSDYSGSVTLSGLSGSFPVTCSEFQSGTLLIQATAPDSVGVYTASVEIDDASGGLTISTSAGFSLTNSPPPFSVSTPDVAMQANQTMSAVTVGVINGYFGNPGDYSGTFSDTTGDSYPLTAVSDGSGNLLLQISGTAPSSAGAQTGFITVTDTDPGSGLTASASNSASFSCSPAAFTVATPTSFTLANAGSFWNDGLSGTVGQISHYNGQPSDYSGIIAIDDNSYSLSFSDDGSGNLLVQCGAILLAPGNYSAQLNVTDAVSGLFTNSVAAFNVWAVQPIAWANGLSNSATYGVPWSGTVATFNDDPAFNPNPSAANHVSASVAYTQSYNNTFTSNSSSVSGANGSFAVNDTQTFAYAADYAVQTAISDTEGQSASASGDVNVSLPAFSVSTQTPTVVEGQSQNNVVIGTLTDTAGAYSIASDFSAVYTIPVAGGTSYPADNLAVALVPDSPTDGVYTLTVLNLPALPADQPAGTLYVSETVPGASNSVSTGVGVNVSSQNTVQLMRPSTPATPKFRQPGPVVIAYYSDTLDWNGNMNPSAYTATLLLNDQTYAVTFGSGDSGAIGDGTVNLADGSSLAPGTYTGTLTVTNDPGAGDAQCSVEIDVADAPPSAPIMQTITATEGTSWTGNVATFTTFGAMWSNYYVTPSDYTAIIDYGDGTTPQTGTITGSDGFFTVSDTHTFNLAGSAPTVSITENAGNSADTSSTTGSASISLPPITVNVPSQISAVTGQGYSGVVGVINGSLQTGADFSGSITVAGENGTVSVVGHEVDGTLPSDLAAGTYTATLTVVESLSNPTGTPETTSATNTFSLVVSNGYLKVTTLAIYANVGEQFSGTVATFTDTDPNAGTISAYVAWGEGSGDGAGAVSGNNVSGNHTYQQSGYYLLSVSMSDSESNTDSSSAEAFAAPITLNSLTVRDSNDHGNSVISTTIDAPDLYVAETATGIVSIDLLPDVTPSTSDALQHVLWNIDPSDDANPDSGTFRVAPGADTVTAELTPVAHTFIVAAGVDTNGDGHLTAGEVTEQVTVHILDATAKTVTDNIADGDLAKNVQRTVGAFVPINNGDDDYNDTPDFQQNGPVVGEDHLLPIVLHQITGDDPGNYVLDIPSNVRVWTNSDRSGPVSPDTEISAAADTTLYVEGVEQGSGTLVANWSNETKSVNDADELKITTFSWSGPLDVPGDAVYTYTASGALPGSGWIDSPNTVIMTGLASSTATIRWDDGPEVGHATCWVNDSYRWDMDVNVVEVKLKFDATNSIHYNSNPRQLSDARTTVESAPDGTDVIVGDITLDTMAGPMVNGKMRGLKFMELGFIQNVRFTQKSGDFYNLPKIGAAGDGRRRLSPLPGLGYVVDYRTIPVRSQEPWADSTDVASESDKGEYYKPGPSANTAVSSMGFEYTDRPVITASDVNTLTESGITDSKINYLDIVFDANLYFAVRTTKAVNGSDLVYTQLASAAWTFNGSGPVDGSGVWTPAGAGQPNGPAGTDGAHVFSQAPAGATVPITSGTPANDLFMTEPGNWSTVNI